MYNTYVSSHIALRSKGSLCFSINDYYYSNERFEKNPLSSSSSSCTCCCSFSNHGMHINPRFVYGLRQSSLIHCYASRRLIFSGGDRYCRSQSSDLDRVCCRDSYSLKESNISRRRKENLRERRDRRFRCMVWEEKFGDCDSGVDENVEAMLSLLTEDISENRVGIGKRNSKLGNGRIRVETRNGGVRECSKEEKKYVVSDSIGKKSRGETESNILTSREDAWSGGRKGSSLRSENGGLRKEGSSCSSYYSMLSSGDLDESDVDIHVDDETYVSESLSSYENKESRKNEENLFAGNVTKQQKKYKEDVRQYGGVSTQGNTSRLESSVDGNSRNKVEKRAEVSVGRIGNRKESRVQDMYEIGVNVDLRNKVEKRAELSAGRIGNRKESRVQDMYEIGVDVDLRNKVEKRAELSAGRIGNRKESRVQDMHEIGVDVDSRNKVEKLAEVSVGRIGTRNESRVQDMYEIGVDRDSRNKVEKLAEVSVGRIGTRNESRVQDMYEIDVERASRNKVEKLAEVSVGRIGTRNESRVQDMYEIGVERASSSQTRSNDRENSSTTSINYVEETKDQRSQTGHEVIQQSGSGRRTQQLSERLNVKDSSNDMASSSQKRFSGREEKLTASVNLGREARERNSQMDHRISQQNESMRKFQQLSEMSEIYNSAVERTSSSQMLSETRMKTREENSSSLLSSLQETQERRTQANQQVDWTTGSGKESQDLTNVSVTSAIDTGVMTSSQNRTEIARMQDKKPSSVVNLPSESGNRYNQTGEQVTSQFLSRNESERLNKSSSFPKSSTGRASGSQTPFNLVQQSIEQQVAEQKEDGINSQVMVTPPPSQSVARGSTKTIPSQKTTKGYGTQDVTRESSKSSSSTLHTHSQEEIPTLSHEPDGGFQSNEISPEQSELIINEDALVSANRLEESSTMFVGEFMDKLRHEVSTSELLEERTSSQTTSGHKDENSVQQSSDPQASEDFQSQVHGSRKSSSESRRKGPADEMWDVAGPSSMEPSKTEALGEVTPTSGGRIAKSSPRSLWSIISDVVRLRWGARSETHNLTVKSGGRSSSNESTGSERWFSGHEPDDKDDEYAKKSRRSTPKRSRSADKRSQRKSPRSQSEGEAYDGRSSRDEMIQIGNDTPPSSNVAEISPASKGASSASKEETSSWREDENREQATPVGTTTVVPSSSLLTKRFIRSPPVRQEPFESNIEVSTSGSTEMVEQPIGERPTEATGTEGKDGELKRRKLQRNKQVLTERFEEWEEAYIIESEQRKIDETFMREALLEAKKAGDTWEVPVGAVLVQDGKIIARGCNLVEELRDSTAHAEMICIREASNVLRTWRLSETTLYVTLEPCPMCAGAILQARVDTVVWGAPNKLLGADGSWVRLFPGGNGEGGSGPDMTAQSAGPVHPFHPKITIRRGILAAECADAMKQFFQLRRKEKKKSESPPPPTCLPIGSHHQSKIFSKMHDPELFLYTKENDAYLWRCKKTSWVPMITDDFDDLGKVTDHLDLVGDMFEWERADYDALIAYISSRRLLVNGQGLVSTELYISGQDGNLNRSQLPYCYIRSLDVLNMKTYIPNLRERLIPSRTVQYLEGDGRAARVLVNGSSSGSSTLPNEIIINLRNDLSKEKSAKEALEKEISDLKAANETLEGSITKLTVDLAARSSEVDASKEKVDDLEAMNKVLESIVATLIADQAACTNEVATLQQVLEQVKNESVRKMAALEAKNEALEDDVTELTANLATRVNELNTSLRELNGVKSDNLALMRQAVDLQDEVDSPVWMNGLTNSDWVCIEDLEVVTDEVGSITASELPRGTLRLDETTTFRFDETTTFRFDVNTTNVRTSYFYSYQIGDDEGFVVAFEDLSPNVEKARFNPDVWAVHYGEVVLICSVIGSSSELDATSVSSESDTTPK